jgi:hypothetical protein
VTEETRVAAELEAWRARLEGAAADETFEIAWDGAWGWATDPGVTPILDTLLDADGERWAGSLAPFQRRLLAIREQREAARLIARGSCAEAAARERVASSFGRRTYDRVAEVLRLADFAACRRFVMVGCGPFPAAALLVRDATAVPEIVAVDSDESAAATARRVVEAMGERRIQVVCADGAAYDYGGAQIVYLANQVCGKNRVLGRVEETAPNAVVVLREPYGIGRLFAEEIGGNLPEPFRAAARGENCAAFFSRHVLLSRDGMATGASRISESSRRS